MHPPNKHVQRSERTRAALLAAARELFGRRGYGAVPVEEVVRRAGVTRGALYHQFPGGKEELFRAVFEEVEGELLQQVETAGAALGPADPLSALRAGVDAALDASLDPAVARLTLLDAPAVLGWEAWRALGERYALGVVRDALEAAVEAGALAPVPVEPLAHALLAAIEESALWVARAEDGRAARAAAGEALEALLAGLVRAPG
jgi:AcrR family transcriptional regulator